MKKIITAVFMAAVLTLAVADLVSAAGNIVASEATVLLFHKRRVKYSALTTGGEVQLTRSQYRKLHVGDKIILHTRKGRVLGLPWGRRTAATW